MSHTPHELSEEFPGMAEKINEMKQTDVHFARMVDDYFVVNREIHNAESRLLPTDDFHETDLRKRRLHLKDEISRLLNENA